MPRPTSALWKAALVALAVLVARSAPARADAGAAVRWDGPCAGCKSSLPATDEPRPLLVVLHGDGDRADDLFAAWAPAAAERGVALLVPPCPRSEGCSSRSFWRWNGSPAWLRAQVDAMAAHRRIDRDRVWLAGWSGGASYIGMRTQELEETFAAIVLHGGGVPPLDPRCSTTKASVYFLVGDKNPLHGLAVSLRDHYVACDQEVRWTILPGADHGGERRALASHQAEIFDWLLDPRRVRPVPEAGASDATVTDGASIDAGTIAPELPSLPPRAAPPPSCRCEAAGRDEGTHALLAGIALSLLGVLRQRRRTPSTR